MDYQRVYGQITERSKRDDVKRRLLKKEGAYFEHHHIIPKSQGGSNKRDNLVLLTAREHFICHWLLYKINPCPANAYAWWMMSNNNGNVHHTDRVRQNSRTYEQARRVFAKAISEQNKGRKISEEQKQILSSLKRGERNHMYGRHHTEEHKRKLSEANSGENNPFYGKKHTDVSKQKISEAKKLLVGELHPHFGKTDLHTDSFKQKLSEMYKGKPRKKPHGIVTCPHCHKQGIKPNMIRWHFDKCKEKYEQPNTFL